MEETEHVSLRDYLQTQLEDMRKHMTLIYASHAREHAMEHEALEKAAKAIDNKLEQMNEFRAQLLEERRLYVTHMEFEAEHEALSKRLEGTITINGGRISVLERAQASALGSLWMLGIMFTILGAALGLLFRFWK